LSIPHDFMRAVPWVNGVRGGIDGFLEVEKVGLSLEWKKSMSNGR